MILSNLWMTLQKVEAAGHGDYIDNFAGNLCFMERKLAVIEENLFNTKAVGIKTGTDLATPFRFFAVGLRLLSSFIRQQQISCNDCKRR